MPKYEAECEALLEFARLNGVTITYMDKAFEVDSAFLVKRRNASLYAAGMENAMRNVSATTPRSSKR